MAIYTNQQKIIIHDLSMIDNLAYDGVISQIPSGSQPANLANDGNQTTCSKTVGKNVRLQVDMKEILIVTELHLTSKGMINC